MTTSDAAATRPLLDHRIDDDQCRRAREVLEFVGRRWTSGVMLALGRGATRFGEVQRMVDGISPRLLSVRLRELEEHGLVERVVTPTTPVSVGYHLSAQGRELLASMQPLVRYGQRWEPDPPSRH
ncbi:winged helix-turn-helix transcriptional regulator [Nocardioides bruguierae]|uniref:winged helix-turn-helix transcriptional regulator n=1 Tax=Nocardioides bruguierae TaxID=2945102 RepID=UPI002020C288|nr:helix-turn-helix domain-containing protein [Nocardioides bruguierae]MCL8026109.1 helix-turn-helix transcriptional regulator [Nocardioides bruguierae]